MARTTQPTARRYAPLRIGVIGVGRIGRMHAELLARQVPGAALAAVYDATRRRRARRRRPSSASPSRPASTSCSRAATSTRSRSARRTDTHADLIVAAARGRQGDLLREAGLARPRRGRPRAGRRRRRPASRSRSASTAASTPPTRRSRDAVADGDDRRRRTSCASPAATPRRRRSSTSRGSGGIFLDMTIHDFDMARYVTGSEVVEVYARGARARRPGVRRGRRRRHRGGHARRTRTAA